jgi:hypothetical protein
MTDPPDFSAGAYEPPPKVRQLLMSYLSSEERSMAAILTNAGLSWKWYYEKFQCDEQAVAWFNAERDKLFDAKLGNVWDAVYEAALSGSANAVAAAKLYAERFDKKYKPQTNSTTTIEVRMRPDEPETRMARLREKFAVKTLPPSPDGAVNVQVEVEQPPFVG